MARWVQVSSDLWELPLGDSVGPGATKLVLSITVDGPKKVYRAACAAAGYRERLGHSSFVGEGIEDWQEDARKGLACHIASMAAHLPRLMEG